MKIAIALQADGVTLAHFGHAEMFLVYEDADNIFQLSEGRNNAPPCGREDSGNLMTAAARLISDCAVVVAARFGPCALREVGNSGVHPFEMDGVLDDKLLAGLARMRDYMPGGRSKQRRRIY